MPSFSKYLLSANYVSDAMLGIWENENQIRHDPCFKSYTRGESDNKYTLALKDKFEIIGKKFSEIKGKGHSRQRAHTV
jgi:hypothetical protein